MPLDDRATVRLRHLVLSTATGSRSTKRCRGRGSGAQGVGAAGDSQLIKKLRQHDDGSVWAEDLEMLRHQEQEAAQQQSYRHAQLLHDIRHALGPKPQLTLGDCAPTGVDAQLEFFLQNGFCILHNVLTADVSQPPSGCHHHRFWCACACVAPAHDRGTLRARR